MVKSSWLREDGFRQLLRNRQYLPRLLNRLDRVQSLPKRIGIAVAIAIGLRLLEPAADTHQLLDRPQAI